LNVEFPDIAKGKLQFIRQPHQVAAWYVLEVNFDYLRVHAVFDIFICVWFYFAIE
jgi:hypothetical protein